ncbi:site-2 protease family protein [Bacillus bombysepticus]|uniref:site-2 protease family protein n=1 Tax=Bacillus bombysepticus TaxID=658666 RepID=UPI0030168CE0
MSLIIAFLLNYLAGIFLGHYIGFFAHEAGHAIVARIKGYCVSGIYFENMLKEDKKTLFRFRVAQIPIIIKTLYPNYGYARIIADSEIPKVNDSVHVLRNDKGNAVDFILADKKIRTIDASIITSVTQAKESIVVEAATTSGTEIFHIFKKENQKTADEMTSKDKFLIALGGPIGNMSLAVLFLGLDFMFFDRSILGVMGLYNFFMLFHLLSSKSSDGVIIKEYLRTMRTEKGIRN